MYESYWQLAQKPFEQTTDPRFYYPSEAHQGALLKLRYAIENRRGAAFVAGAGGVGKTLLVQALGRHLSEEFSPLVRLVFPQMPPDELLAYLADELVPERPAGPRPLEQSVRRIQGFLAENSGRGRHAVVVVDEAHLVDDESLEVLRLLLNFETDGRPQLTLLLVAQPALLPRLERLLGWEERLAARCLLRPFSQEETLGYVQHRLTAAGGSRAIFETSALEALHEAALGIPRRINRLADLALLVGYAEELPSIGAAQIEALEQELTLPALA